MRHPLTGLMMMVAASAPASAGSGSAARLSDDLCNFAIEGLTLESTIADVAAVFGPKGWHDLTTPPATARNRQTVQEVIFDAERATPGPNQGGMGSANRFGMTIADGRPRGMTLYGDGPPSGLERARALCGLFDDRFWVSGCRADDLRSPHASRSPLGRTRRLRGNGARYTLSCRVAVLRVGPFRSAAIKANRRHSERPPAPSIRLKRP